MFCDFFMLRFVYKAEKHKWKKYDCSASTRNLEVRIDGHTQNGDGMQTTSAVYTE